MKNENDRILLFSQTLSVAMFDSSIVITILGVEPEGKSAHVYLTVSRKRNIVDILTKNVVQFACSQKIFLLARKQSEMLFMPLVPAKCTNCGAVLNIDDSRESFICRYCGSPFIVEKAISNYNTTNNVTNNIHAQVVNMYGDTFDDYEIVGGRLVKYRGKSTSASIPGTVIAIADDAFKESAIESVVIPGSVKLANGFHDCDFLTSVSIEDGVREIGAYAFYNCKNLTTIIIPSSVKKISDKAFYECEALQHVDFPIGLEEIGDSAFSYCKSLKSIDLPESVTRIGHCAFSFCDTLHDITIRGEIENQHYDIDYLGRAAAYEYPFESDYKLFESYKKAKATGSDYQRYTQRVSTNSSNEFIFEHSLWKRIRDFELSSNQSTSVTDKSNPPQVQDDNKIVSNQDKSSKKKKSFFKRLKEPVNSLEEANAIKSENKKYFLLSLTVFLVSVSVIVVLTLLNKFTFLERLYELEKLYELFAFIGMIGMGLFGVISYLIKTVMKKIKNLTCDKCGSKLKNDENTTWKELSHHWRDINEYSSTLWLTLQINCICPNCKQLKSFNVNLSSGNVSITDHSLDSTLKTTQSVVDDYFNGIIHK